MVPVVFEVSIKGHKMLCSRADFYQQVSVRNERIDDRFASEIIELAQFHIFWR